MRRIVCLISGRGSNLESILRTAAAENWASEVPARVVAAVSSRADAAGLAVASAYGVPTAVIEHRRFASREAFDAKLAEAIDEYSPDVVVLAGFMRVLGSEFVARFAGRLINVHPSLLPAFPGLATHRRALDAGVRVHGATVHFVSGEVDGGAIIAQAAVAVPPGEGEEALAARVLQREHVLLPRCVRWVCEGRVALSDGRAVVGDLPADALALLG